MNLINILLPLLLPFSFLRGKTEEYPPTRRDGGSMWGCTRRPQRGSRANSLKSEMAIAL